MEDRWENESPETVARILEQTRTIAVVGLSSNRWRASNSVSEYMQRAGYRIIPVNPNVTEVLGEKAYATLGEIPEKIDLVDIFRRPEFVRPVVESAIRIGAKAIWMQETVEDVPAGRLAREGGLKVMMDSCIMREHARWLRDRKS
jgi:predicted CoA-binding protein